MASRRVPRPRRWPLRLAILAAIALIIVADHRGWLLVPRGGNDLDRYDGAFVTVVRVIDGDTIEVDLADPRNERTTTRIRMWGIDAPELSAADSTPEAFAVAARTRARELVLDRRVTLHLERHRTRGTFGRVLAHVELADGSLLNETLIDEGLARIDDRWPHAHQSAYARAQRSATRRRAGVWKPAVTASGAVDEQSGE